MNWLRSLLPAPCRLVATILCGMLWAVSQCASAQQCTTTANAPVFGSYLSSGSGNNVAGSITVSCVVLGAVPIDVFYSINIDPGGNAQGTQRRMGFGSNYLNYNIYCDIARSQIWADANNSTCVITGGQSALLGTRVTLHPVYGRIPGGQYVAAGVYTDILQVQVLY
jgi:spore coat protein U-like protein